MLHLSRYYKAQLVINYESTVCCHTLHDALLTFKTLVKIQNSIVELSLYCPFYKTKFTNLFRRMYSTDHRFSFQHRNHPRWTVFACYEYAMHGYIANNYE
jgi:hypothetical protein